MVQEGMGVAAPKKNTAMMGCITVLIHLSWIGLLAGGVYTAYSSFRLMTQGATTTGTVVDMAASHDQDGDTYAPVVEYQAGGETYRFQSDTYTNPPSYHVGQQVQLIYDPGQPKKARINNVFELWLLPGLLLAFGLGDAAVAFFVTPLLLGRRKQ